MKEKPTILTFTGYYLPGYKGGGPIRSIENLVEALGNEMAFKIVTVDRDFGDSEPYEGIKTNGWQKVGKAQVLYLSAEKINWISLRNIIASIPHDILYLNSFFSPKFTIMPLLLRRFGLITKKTTIIAPRGEFSTGALKLKSVKKSVYIKVARLLRLYENVIWQVSSAHEKEDLYRIFKNGRRTTFQLPTIIAPNLPDIKPIENNQSTPKAPGSLKVAFLSRISPKKNLVGALDMIAGLQGNVLFNIFGPLEDRAYWENCQRIIEKLPNNIMARYHGMVAHDEVPQVMAKHDLFFFPTLGENFGHVIIEALSAGCPILISDQTPWRNLEQEGIGWDLPLDQPERFTAILQQCVDMADHELSNYSHRARKYAEKIMTDVNVINQNRALFLDTI